MLSGLMVGYARVSTDAQDLTAQRDALKALGVGARRIYVDHGLTGRNRERPGLRQAMAACREGDTLVVAKLDRLARSVPDARDIAAELTAAEVKLNLGGSVYDPLDPVGRLLFDVLAMVAEFEADLIRARAREGMAVAKAKGACGVGSPSSALVRRPTWRRCMQVARPALASWPSWSGSDARPSSGPSSALRSARRRPGTGAPSPPPRKRDQPRTRAPGRRLRRTPWSASRSCPGPVRPAGG